ncbi:MAG: hypothetical protein ACE5HE_10775 [Phycisphaerae bacterium]
MSAREVAGLAALAGLAGVLLGATVAVVVTSRTHYYTREQTRRTQVYTRWLAARLTVSRASLSFVAAFRSLAAEHSDSTYFVLRVNEAQRARAYWCRAMQMLELAEAALITHTADDAQYDPHLELSEVSASSLRRAIHGNAEDVQALARRLHAADRSAIHRVRQAVNARRTNRTARAVKGVLARTAGRFKAVVDRWADTQ